MAVGRTWWQHSEGWVTRFWSSVDLRPSGNVYESEREAVQAARHWLAEEINRLQSRGRALAQREQESAGEQREHG